MTIDDNYTSFTLTQKNTQFQRIPRSPRPEIPTVPETPQKIPTPHEPLSGSTSALMRIVKKVPVKLLAEYFEQTSERRPHTTAVICGSSQLTYQELDQQANRLAHLLISRGIGPSDTVGILLDRSLTTYIALLGILKAGAAFVPLDPAFSLEHVTFIAQDAMLRHLITTSTFRAKTRNLTCPILEFDQEYEAFSAQPANRPQITVNPASLCHIIYNLDSGNPSEGIAFSHANIVNFLRAITPVYRVTRDDRVYQGMSIAYDHSFEEIWPAWIAGATLVANPIAFHPSGHELTEFLIAHKITVFCCIPAQLAAIERDVPSLRSLFVGGEVCPEYLVSRWARPGRRILNTYGCTETTVTATWSEMFPGRPVTIGTPLSTYHVYLLDNQLRPVKDGETGEIFIGGLGVALGYLNRPELTQKRFIPNPILNDREMMPCVYRTGDLGRITPAGEIEYLGQINAPMQDRQIQLSQNEQMALFYAKPIPLTDYASVSQFETVLLPKIGTQASKPGILQRIKSIYQQIMTDPLYRNSLFTIASTLILGGLGFIFWIIIARLYKPENVGIATTLISIMTLLSGFTILGLNGSLNRYLPKSTNKNELINSAFVIVMVATILACIIFLLGLQVFSPQLVFLRSNALYIISFSAFVIFCSWNMLIDSTFMAFRSASNILLKNTTVSVLKLVLPFALIALGAYGIFTATAAAVALGVLIGLVILLLHFKIKPSISVNFALIRETAAYSFANYVAGFMLNMPSQVLPIIILNTLSAKYAAYYYVASMIQNILQVIPMAAAQALLTEGSYNEAGLKKHVKKAITTILLILLPAVIITVFGSNILLQLFGKGYASGASQFLQLYSASTVFAALLLISNAIMNVKHQIKSLIVSNLVAAILTLGLSYAFISNKLVGIGWGWMLGQAITGVIALSFIIHNYAGDASPFRRNRASRL
jgi:amino acid adenylation domain-containing protein